MTDNEQPRLPTSCFDRVTSSVLYSIFLLTGTAVVLPGTLLPLLTRTWHMGDGTAGIFFLCFSVGSSGGALLARGKLSGSLTAGCTMVALGAVLMANDVTGALLAVIALYGCGLGLSMTSISLLQSRRSPKHRIAEFARLNLTWAIGAGCGPALLLRSAVRYNTTAVLNSVSAVFLAFALLVLLTVRSVEDPDAHADFAGSWTQSLRALPLGLLFLISLATGVESGLNSWLASYMMRGGYVLGITITATTAFGVGIIVSRLLHSRRSAQEGSARLIMQLHPLMMVVAIVLLVFSHSSWLSVLAAFLAGAGVGPMYPLTLALQLGYRHAGRAGFLAGGLGASVIPMITGAVAGRTHSLRDGLCVPLAAAAIILTLCANMPLPGRAADKSVSSPLQM